MQMFAVTYTDPSEPWGAAVEDGKLYRTPSALVDAANAHFDAWCAQKLWKGTEATRLDSLYIDWLKWGQTDHPGRSFEDHVIDEYSREHGLACYQVVD